MLNKLKKILQWFVSVCFILSGLIYVGEYTVPAIVLMVLAGVIVLPPVTKKIPAFKFRKAILKRKICFRSARSMALMVAVRQICFRHSFA